MTHEMALKLAQAETPEQMADRIVELYETIDDLRASLEQYRNGYQGSCMACEPVAEENRKLEMQIDKTRKALRTVTQMASAYVSVSGNARARERLEKALASIEEDE